MNALAGNAGSTDGGRLPAVTLVVILLLAAGLRLYRLDGESAFCDEVATVRLLEQPDLGSFLRAYRLSGDIASPPAYLVAEYLWARVAGSSVYAVRLLSVLFGLASIVFVFLIGRDLFGAATGVGAALLAGVSMTHLYYSQEIRAYALVMALASVSAWSFTKILRNGGKGWWAVHVAANVLLPLTHLMAAFMLLAEGVALLLLHGRRVRLVATWMGANLCACLPTALWLLALDWTFAEQSTSWMAPVTPVGFLGALPLLAGAWTPWSAIGRFAAYNRLDAVVSTALWATAYAALAGVVVSVVLRTPKTTGGGSRPTEREGLVFVLAWLLVPPGVLLVLSHLWRPCFVERYVIYSALPFAVIMAAAVTRLPGRRAKVAAAVALVLLYAQPLTHLGGPLRPDWRHAAAHVRDHGADTDLVYVRPFWQRDSFRFYSDLPDAQIHPFDDWRIVYRRAGDVLAEGHALWAVVFPTGEDRDAFEAGLAERDLPFEKAESRGLVAPVLYRISPRP